MKKLVHWVRDFLSPAPPPWLIGLTDRHFESDEELIAYLREQARSMQIDRVRRMRSWERSIRISTTLIVAAIALQLALAVWLDGFGGAPQFLAVGFLVACQNGSVRLFRQARDRLLEDLENDPEAEVWWYDAWTREST